MEAKNITVFRGYSGEIVADILSPRTALSAAPVFALYSLCFGCAYGLSEALAAPWILLVLSPFIVALAVGRFALSAREGALHAGFFHESFSEAEALQYAGRYLLTLMLFCLPQYLALYLLYHRATTMMTQFAGLGMGMPFMMNSPALYAILGVAFLLLFVLFVLTPSLCALFTTCTVELSEVLRTDIWGWIFFERGRDLIVLYSALFGGMVFCALCTTLPIGLFSTLFVMSSPGLSQILMGVAAFAPLCVYPILLGRLCGAFVIGDAGLSGEQEATEPPFPQEEEGKRESSPSVTPQEKAQEVAEADEENGLSPKRSTEKDEEFKDFDPNSMLITDLPGRMKSSFIKVVEEPDDDPFSPQYDDQPPESHVVAGDQHGVLLEGAIEPHSMEEECVVGGARYLELNAAPSETFMLWVQDTLSQLSPVEEAFLYRKCEDGNAPIVSLGIGIKPGVNFHDQREVLRILSEQAGRLSDSDRADIALMNELNIEPITKKGRLIFKK